MVGFVGNLSGFLEKIMDKIVEATRVVCEVLVTVMMLLITSEVILRSAFNFSLQISDEISGYLLVGLTFLAVTIALQEGALFRVEFFFDRLPMRIQGVFRLGFDVLSLTVAAVLEYELVFLVITSFTRENKSLSLIATPLYIPQLVMPIGMAILLLMFLASIVKDVRDIVKSISVSPDKE